MRAKPIIFNAAMVRAIIEGRKTQTRRILNADVPETRGGRWDFIGDSGKQSERNKWCYSWLDQWGNRISPKGKEPGCLVTPPYLPGDRLWVRENWAWYPLDHDPSCVIYRADYEPDACPPAEFGAWKSSANMPRWASRTLLEVVDVRVERIRTISEVDARAEGFDGGDPIGKFADLWNSAYGQWSWAANPWVWVIEFRRVEP